MQEDEYTARVCQTQLRAHLLNNHLIARPLIAFFYSPPLFFYSIIFKNMSLS